MVTAFSEQLEYKRFADWINLEQSHNSLLPERFKNGLQKEQLNSLRSQLRWCNVIIRPSASFRRADVICNPINSKNWAEQLTAAFRILTTLVTFVIIFFSDYIGLIINSEKAANLILKRRPWESRKIRWRGWLQSANNFLEGNKI